MRASVYAFIAMLIIAAYSTVSSEDIYTWKDENGVLHFTDTPDKKVVEQGKSVYTREKTSHPKIVFTEEDRVNEALSPFTSIVISNIRNYIFYSLGYKDSFYEPICKCKTTKVVDEIFSVNEYTKGGWTPLTLAVSGGCFNVVKYLIHKGADVNLKHKEGFTPLHLAVVIGEKDVIDLLITAGADVNYVIPKPESNSWHDSMSGTPLETALKNFGAEKIKLLLSKGADCKVKNRQGHNVMEVARRLNLLDELHTIMNSLDNDTPNNLVTFGDIKHAIYNSRITGKELRRNRKDKSDIPIRMINENPQLIFRNDSYGNTLLHAACRGNQVAIVKVLIDKGLNVNQRNSRGETPLHLTNKIEVIQLMLRHGASLNATTDYERSLLHCLVRLHETTDLNTFKSVINAGCNKYKRDRDGKTAYDYAKKKKYDGRVLEALK